VLTRTQKEDQVAEIRDKLARADGVYIADYRGIDVDSVNALRSELHHKGEGDYEYQVVKNSVLRRASADGNAEVLTSLFEGPTAIAFSYGDPAGLAKILVDYAKTHEVFELKGGLLDGKAIDEAEIVTLAMLPSLDQLRGQMVGLIQAPATKLVRLLCEPGSQLARLVEARRGALEGGEG
jgi:large subunit ribosomal protein L10